MPWTGPPLLAPSASPWGLNAEGNVTNVGPRVRCRLPRNPDEPSSDTELPPPSQPWSATSPGRDEDESEPGVLIAAPCRSPPRRGVLHRSSDPWDSILAVISSPTHTPSIDSTFGMQVDSDGDCAHGFFAEDRRTGLLVQRPSPTVSCSGDSISSGDLEGSYGTPADVRGLIGDSESSATTWGDLSNEAQKFKDLAAGMQVDSDGDFAHEFLVEDRRTGLLLRRPPPTVSGDSILSGDLEAALFGDFDEGASEAPRRETLAEWENRWAIANQSARADAQSASRSPSSVPTVQLTTRRRRQATSFFSTRERRSPLPMPGRQRPRTRNPSCVTVPSIVSDDGDDVMDL